VTVQKFALVMNRKSYLTVNTMSSEPEVPTECHFVYRLE
jgi:hypothetical protein